MYIMLPTLRYSVTQLKVYVALVYSHYSVVEIYTYICMYIWIFCIFQPITQGDITGYQVYYNGTMKNVNSSTTTLTFTAPSLPVGVFSGIVVVMVTAVNRFGNGPASDPKIAVINGMYVCMHIHCLSHI